MNQESGITKWLKSTEELDNRIEKTPENVINLLKVERAERMIAMVDRNNEEIGKNFEKINMGWQIKNQHIGNIDKR